MGKRTVVGLGGWMSVRKHVDMSLSAKQRLTLFHGTDVTAEKALLVSESELNFDMLMTHGVRAVGIATAGLRPLALKTLGVTNSSQLRRLGFDALHLVDTVWCQEATAAYGAQDVVEVFLQTPSDAVALAGSEALSTLGIGMQRLLEVCAGAPTEAVAVLQQVPLESPLEGVSAVTLLDTGLRAPQLKQMGFGISSVRAMRNVGHQDLAKLGFTL